MGGGRAARLRRSGVFRTTEHGGGGSRVQRRRWCGYVRRRRCGVEFKEGGPMISACVPGWRSAEIAVVWCSAGKTDLGVIPALCGASRRRGCSGAGQGIQARARGGAGPRGSEGAGGAERRARARAVVTATETGLTRGACGSARRGERATRGLRWSSGSGRAEGGGHAAVGLSAARRGAWAERGRGCGAG